MTYGYCKKIIASGKYDKNEMKDKLDVFLLANRITDEQYKELIQLINGGEVTLDTPITRAEHEEFRRRIEEEHSRQNRRLELLEESIERLNALNTSIEKLALNMESMLKEQVRQGKRLEVLENRDGEMWRKLLSHAVTTVVGIIVGYIFTHIGF